MIEEYSREAEIRKIKLGLFGAITAVNLRQEGKDKESKQFEPVARDFLNYLADPESLIHKIRPNIFEENKDIIEKARETFPEPESFNYLQKLLDVYG